MVRIFAGRNRKQIYEKFNRKIAAIPVRGALPLLLIIWANARHDISQIRELCLASYAQALNRRVTAFLAEPIKDWLKVLVNSRLKSAFPEARWQKWHLCGLKSIANGKSVDLACALVLSKLGVNALHRPAPTQAEKSSLTRLISAH
jgi:hypothetical protein